VSSGAAGLWALWADLVRLTEKFENESVPCPACGTPHVFSTREQACLVCGEPVPPPPTARWVRHLWSAKRKLRQILHAEHAFACRDCAAGECSGRPRWQPPGPECPDRAEYEDWRRNVAGRRVRAHV